jgi:DNA-binding PadR family transcriptional regulator
MTLTPLNYILIGLAAAEPRSGYALRRVFEDTPMARYSSSPGSIYPALKKLEKEGLVAHPAEGRGAYHATEAGRAALADWLAEPVTLRQVADLPEIVMLRFAFLEHAPRARTGDFLTEYAAALEAHLAALTAFLESAEGRALSRHGSLAVRSGVEGYRAQLAWVRRAQAELGLAEAAA